MTQRNRHFVICGLSRLAVRVSLALVADGADVTLIRRGEDGDDLAHLLPAIVQVLTSPSNDLDHALTTARLTDAACLLALSDEDLDNLRAGVAAQALAPGVPVVLRTFDPVLADHLEIGFNVRRAYSVSGLAAPAFIAAAVGAHVYETLRLGEDEVPICRLTLGPQSPLVGLNATQMKQRHGCALLARSGSDGVWLSCPDGSPTAIGPGDEIIIGGWLPNVLRAACRNAGWLPRKRRRRAARPKPRVARPRHLTHLPLIAAPLLLLLVVAVVVFQATLHLKLIDAVYFVITTATTTGYGDISLKDAPDWVKLFGGLIMLSGGALLGIMFSALSAMATAERLDEVMGRRAQRMARHVVVAGLGNVGYRVARTLAEIGLDVVAIDLAPNPRADALRPTLPVVFGDIRLPETLERASIGQAVGFLACTDDDLADIQSCLRAKRANPAIKTVARVFDDVLAERLTRTFAIDQALSASQAAAGAFVGAALDERALRRIHTDGLSLLACRYTPVAAIPLETIRDWRRQGVRLLALQTASGRHSLSTDLPRHIVPGDEAILCGPSDAILAIVSPPSPIQA